MALISKNIPNLINGVSQQAPTTRLPSQGELQENAISSIVEGLKKRPPLGYVAKLTGATLTDAYVHTINRDPVERYVVVITNGDLKVYDLNGVEKTVAFPNGKTYLNGATPSSGIRAMTVSDYTFIVNTTVTATMSASLSPSYGSAGLIFVRQGSYGSNYAVRVNGTTQAGYTTSTTDVTTLATDFIADHLADDLVANLGTTNWTINQIGSTVELKRNNGSAFTLNAIDSQAGNSLKIIKEKVQRFTDLPTFGPKGFVVEITGDNLSKFDNYYVKFEPSDPTDNFGEGVWLETVKPGIPFQFNAATMPHILVRETNGTFTFKQATWGSRVAGDETSAPTPSFIGQKIQDVFFFKNRLGFISDENVIFSRAGSYFDFFPETVTQILDSDPIDVSVAHTKVSILKHAIPFNERLLLFSEQTQFILDGGDLLTPRTVSITPTTEFTSSPLAKPVGAGANVYFVTEKNNWSSVREYFVSDDNNTNDASDITAHVPTYIPANVSELAVNTSENTLVALSKTTPAELYVHKFYWSGNEKIQSSWSKWVFAPGTTILSCEFISSFLYLVTQYADGVYLERIDITERQQESGNLPLIHLDRKLSNTTSGVSASYNATTDRTTYTLPYQSLGTMQVVVRQTSGARRFGQVLPLVSQTGNTVVVQGDTTAVPVFIGTHYTMRYRLSPIYLRETAQNGAMSVIGEGRLQLRTLSVLYDQSAYFRVEVTPLYRNTYTYEFTGRPLGAGLVVGDLSLVSGRQTVPVLSKNDQVQIDLVNDSPFPSRFTTLEWEGFYASRSTRQ